MSRRWLAALAVAGVAVITGCSSSNGGYNGIYAIPLPGGANLGNHPYQVTAQFADAGDLVPQSAVMVNDVAVGRVTKIFLPPGSWTANRCARFPDGGSGDHGSRDRLSGRGWCSR